MKKITISLLVFFSIQFIQAQDQNVSEDPIIEMKDADTQPIFLCWN